MESGINKSKSIPDAGQIRYNKVKSASGSACLVNKQVIKESQKILYSPHAFCAFHHLSFQWAEMEKLKSNCFLAA